MCRKSNSKSQKLSPLRNISVSCPLNPLSVHVIFFHFPSESVTVSIYFTDIISAGYF